MKILLTGFEAFGSVDENPSQVIVEEFAKSVAVDNLDYADLVCEILPVEYELSKQRICELIDQHKPDAVVMTGVAASRKKINVEFWARNIRSAKIPDNSGVLLKDAPIDSDHPIEHFLPSTLPVATIYLALNRQEIPVERSNNAGGYICNNVFYCAVDHLKKIGRDDLLVGFIHIPLFDAIPREDMLKAYHVILENVAKSKPTKHLDTHMYMNPTIERELQTLFKKFPDNPSWCSLVSVDGYLVGHIGKPVDLDHVVHMAVATDRMAERVASQTLGSVYDYTIMGGLDGIFFVITLNDEYILAINWDKATSLSTPYTASKMFPQILQPLIKALG